MGSQLERTISSAANDIVDSILNGRPRKNAPAIKDFVRATLWHAAASAESLAQNRNWVNPNADNSWKKIAAEHEEYPIPQDISDAQFRGLSEALGDTVQSLRRKLPTRLKLDDSGELQAEVGKILGSGAGLDSVPAGIDAPSPAPERKPDKPDGGIPSFKDMMEKMEGLSDDDLGGSPEAKPLEAKEEGGPPAKRPSGQSAAHVMPEKKNEFDSRIEDNPSTPGDPRLHPRIRNGK